MREYTYSLLPEGGYKGRKRNEAAGKRTKRRKKRGRWAGKKNGDEESENVQRQGLCSESSETNGD